MDSPGRSHSTISDIDSIRANSTASIDRAEALEWRVERISLEIEEQEALPLIAAAYSHLREIMQITFNELNQFNSLIARLEGLATTFPTTSSAH